MTDDVKSQPASDTAESAPTAHEGAKRVGVLFVHGIGMQRQGDTLLQAGAALHHWLDAWLSQCSFGFQGTAVELTDTVLAHARGGEPAHATLVFRGHPELGKRSILLAESCWANAFRTSSYGAFVAWALRGFWLTIVLHLLAVFTRNVRIGTVGTRAIVNRQLTEQDRRQLEVDLGLDPGVIPSEPGSLRRFLDQHTMHAWNRWLISPFLLAFLLVAVIAVQIFLVAIVLVALLPLGFLERLAGRVQTVVAAVLGDSYLFVSSPLSESAAITQVQGDLTWLTERCDAVVVVAHSQGAAVAYRAIEAWSRLGRVPANLVSLITYGSGLQKLFALKALQTQRLSPLSALARRLAVGATVLGAASILSSWALLVFAASWWLVGLSLAVGFVLLMLAHGFFERAFERLKPNPLPGVSWLNLYASADPVCNGPNELQAGPHVAMNSAEGLDLQGLEGGAGWPTQREVVNLDSLLADHTHYWHAADDFVSRVVLTVMRAGGFPALPALDEERMASARLRRRWRVGFLAACRRALVLTALCLGLWPKAVLDRIGTDAIAQIGSMEARWSPWLSTLGTVNITGYPRVVAWGVVLCALVGAYAVAVAGWKVWESHEFAQFFRGAPFRAPTHGICLFAAGWLGGAVATPFAAAMAVGPDALWPLLWTVVLLVVVSVSTSMRVTRQASEPIKVTPP